MSQIQMLFTSRRCAIGIASTKAEEHEKLKPSNTNTCRSIDWHDSQVVPEDADLSVSLRLGDVVAERWESNKAKVEEVLSRLR